MNRKGSVLSRKNTAHAPTAIRDEEPRTPAGSRASETHPGLVHFEGCRKFRLHQLLWGNADVLGKNIYWSTYKATLHNGSPLGKQIYWAAYEASFDNKSPVVVRRLRSEVTEDFVTQVNLLGKIRHSNLLAPRAYYYGTNPEVSAPLIVFVDELDYMQSLSDFIDVKFLQKFLVFDYMPGGSLSKFLHARGNSTPIDWPTRMNIAIGVARGLHHLHTQGNMVHGNLSSVNVLLDDHVNAKIGGYGISKLLNPVAANSYFNFEETTSTSEYRAPELSNLDKANTKTDVYSLGMIMLELLTMKSPADFLDKTQRIASTAEQYTPNIPEFRDTLKLALKCVDASPNVRPEMRKVLQQLEKIKSKFEKTTHTPTDAPALSNITRASPATGDQQKRPFSFSERRTSPFKDKGIRTPRTSNNFANDGNLPQACASENTISSPLASSASDAEAMPAPIDSCKHKVENLATMTPQGDIKDPEIANPAQEEEITQNTSVDEELDDLNPAEHRTRVRADTERCNAMSQGTGASPLSGIDWATVDIQVCLHVPTSPPLISSDPDSGYQRYFRTLHDLAHRSPPLPGDVLEVQLNNMIIGLHSLGYPLDTWVKAANLLLVLAKKQEYIEQHVDDYKVHVEMQLKEFTSAITPAKEEITGTQSEITVLEQKQEELDETIAKLEDQLSLLKAQRQEVVNSLTTARDVLAVAEAKVESIFVRMSCLNQQCSAISNLRRAMLLELPSLDEVFDSTFQEIMTKTF